MTAMSELRATLDRLDAEQLEAVTSDEPVLLLRAPVGSGKTTVLTCRVAWLHAVRGVPLDRIAVLTFTNRAADEIRRRVAALLPGAGGGGAVAHRLRLAGTFHSVARGMLARRLPIGALGYRRGFSVLDEGERARMWERLIAEHGLVIRHRRQLEQRLEALGRGELLHGNMRRPDDLLRLAELAHADKLRRNAMDFGDLIANAHALLCEYPLSPPLHSILIDELQDCDEDQLELVARMRGERTRVLAVGDPAQVIYSWRGSGAGIFADFARRHDAVVRTLGTHHRCPPAILEAARLLLDETGPAVAPGLTRPPVAARPRREHPGPRDDAEDSGPLCAMPHHDELAQARWITARVRAAEESGLPPRRIAVLGRTRRVVAPIAAALRAAGLPVHRPGRERRLDEPVAAWLYRLLRAGLDPDDDERFCLTMADRRRGLCTPRTLNVARLRAAREAGAKGPRRELLATIAARSRGARRPMTAVARRLVDALAALPSLVVEAGPEGAEALSSALFLDEQLGPTTSTFEADRATCLELLRAWLREASEAGAAAAGAGAGRLHAALETVARAPARESPRQGVAVLTMHAAKGLEFDLVIIASCNDGLIPLAASWHDPDQLAEERRLFFVAITRARERVEIGWLKAPADRRVRGEPSPLLELLPEGVIRWFEEPPDPAPHRTEPTTGLCARDRVRHKRYGEGVVLRADGEAIVVDFGGLGERRFSPRLCPVSRVGTDPQGLAAVAGGSGTKPGA